MALEFRTLDRTLDRASFDCGIPELNEFLKREARQQQSHGFNVTFVLVNTDNPTKILGYYSVMSSNMEASLPPKVAKKLPKHPIPAARIGRLARDLSTKGQGIGEKLMVNALERIKRISTEIGIYCVIMDAKNDAAKSFYLKYGFIPFVDAPMSLFLPLSFFLYVVSRHQTPLLRELEAIF